MKQWRPSNGVSKRGGALGPAPAALGAILSPGLKTSISFKLAPRFGQPRVRFHASTLVAIDQPFVSLCSYLPALNITDKFVQSNINNNDIDICH